MSRQFYLPGDYLRRVKRPAQKHVFRQLLLEDAAFWLLLAATGSPPSLRLGAGALLLFFSFWAIYEAGYRDNDACAQRYEADPVLTAEAIAFESRNFEAKTWTAAALLGLAGCWLLQAQIPRWLATLLALRAAYFIFNRIDKPARPLPYLMLQGLRSLALLAVLPVGLAGLLAGLAQAGARSAGYALYRAKPGGWPAAPLRALQFTLFLVLLLAFALAGRAASLGQAVLFLAWSGFLARKELALPRWLPRQNPPMQNQPSQNQPSQTPRQRFRSEH
jgi:F0F1-type ATP synthase membrane subunit c/vacuolar-type H+-ATPase subunit K